MKKVLSVFFMAAIAFGAFADEPVADVNVVEFSGNAAVTWGVDLDSGKTGFKNTSRVDLKLNLLNNGTKSTTGDGVWGELVLKVDGDTFIQWRHDDNVYGDGLFGPSKGMAGTYSNDDHGAFFKKIYVDTAKINFGSAYVGIKTGNTTVGELCLDTAISSEQAWMTNEGADKTQGIVVGFDSDIVKVDVDVRSQPAADQYSNDYGIAAEAELKAVENLSVKAGVSYEFNDPNTFAYAASAGYKLTLNDTFYLRPQVGITGIMNEEPVMAASVLFGWGETQEDNAGVYFVDEDDDMNVTPGVSVAAYISLGGKVADIRGKDFDIPGIDIPHYINVANIDFIIVPSFFSGELVPSLTAAIDAAIVKMANMGFDTFTAMIDTGVKYTITLDAITITPQAGVTYQTTSSKYENYEEPTVNSMSVKFGVDVAGLIDNTTLSAVWASGELLDGGEQAGTLNFCVKIAL